MADDSDNDLSFVSTDALVNELGVRSTHLVVLYVLKSDESETTEQMTIQFRGGAFAAIGLMSNARKRLLSDLHAIDDDD